MVTVVLGAVEVAAALEALRRNLLAKGRLVGRIGWSIYLFEMPEKGSGP